MCLSAKVFGAIPPGSQLLPTVRAGPPALERAVLGALLFVPADADRVEVDLKRTEAEDSAWGIGRHGLSFHVVEV